MTEPSKIEVSRPFQIDAAARLAGLTLITVIGLMIIGKLLYYCDRGFDFVDESYYLNAVNYPEAQKINATQFSHIYAPLWRATGKNLVLYRQANILIIQILAFILSWELLRHSRAHASRLAMIAITFGCASIINTFFFIYLPTPNYNSLALQALLVTSIGIALMNGSDFRANAISWILTGAGGALAFLAKPTTAAILAVLTAIYWFFSGKMRIASLIGAVSTSIIFLLIFSWAVHGSPQMFIANMHEGFLDVQALGSHKASLFRLGLPPTSWRDFLIAIALILCFAIGIIVSAFRSQFIVNMDRTPLSRFASWAIWLALIGISGYSSLNLFAGSTQWPARWDLWSLGTLILFLASIVGSVPTWPHSALCGIKRDSWLIAGLFALLPYAYAFGTNNNYCLIMPLAGAFWLFAAIKLLSDLAPSIGGHCAVILLIAASQVVVILGVHKSMVAPNHQTSLIDAHERIKVGNASVILSAVTIKTLRGLRDILAREGFRPGMGLLDLTGWNPGASFALDAKPVGNAWMFGGFGGSLEFAQRCLDRIDREDIRRAWILMDRKGSRSLPATILNRYNLSLERDYVLAGKIASLRLFRPVLEPRSDTLSAGHERMK